VSFLSVRRIAQAGVVVSLVGGTVGFANLDKSLTLSVDGKSSTVHGFGSTVGDLLAHQGIKINSHDLVAPAVSTPLEDNQKVVVRYGRLLTVTVDGKTKEFWTTSTTVSGALSELGIRADSAKLSVSRAQPLGRLGLSMAVTTPKNVNVSVDGKTLKAQATTGTVAGVLSGLKVKVGSADRVVPALKTPITRNVNVSVLRVTHKTVATSETIAFGTHRRNDASLYSGTTRERTEGKAGRMVVTHLQTSVDGKLVTDKVKGSRLMSAPVPHVIAVGTKARPVKRAPAPVAAPAPAREAAPAPAPERAPAPAPERAPAPEPAPAKAPAPAPSPATSGGGSNENGAMWDRIAECESGGNWSTNTGNGYYGGLQFDLQTWTGAGGGQFAPRADQASREQQIAIANKVYADRGLQPWQCGWAA